MKKIIKLNKKEQDNHVNLDQCGDTVISDDAEVTTNVTIEQLLEAEEQAFLLDVSIEDGCYMTEKGPISNFVVQPVSLIRTEQGGQLLVDLIGQSGYCERHILDTTVFCSVSEFKKIVSRQSLELFFSGGNDDLLDIKRLINAENFARMTGIDYTGMKEIDGEMIFVTGEQALCARGEYHNVIQRADTQVIMTDIMDHEPITLEELREIGPSLFRFNALKRTAPIMGFIAGCLVKEHLHQQGVKFLHLLLVGEAGSGKSQTLENVIMPIMALNNKFSASQITVFSAMRTNSSSNCLPHCIDEYKPSQITKQQDNALRKLLRESYDNQEAQRGTSTQKINTYKMRAPIILVGEDCPEETAIRERSMQIMFAKKDLTDECKQHLQILKDNKTLLPKLGMLLLQEALSLSPADLKELFDLTLAHVQDRCDYPSRIQNTLANEFMGLQLIEIALNGMGTSLEEISGYGNAEFIDAIFAAMEEFQMDGGSHNQSVIDTAFEIFDNMDLVSGQDYTFVKNGTELAIRPKGFYQRYRTIAKQQGLENLPWKSFLRQLKQTSYCIDTNVSVRFPRSGRAQKAIKIDYAKLRAVAELCQIVPTVTAAKADVTKDVTDTESPKP